MSDERSNMELSKSRESINEMLGPLYRSMLIRIEQPGQTYRQEG
jgi:hypothetical protein